VTTGLCKSIIITLHTGGLDMPTRTNNTVTVLSHQHTKNCTQKQI